MLTFSGLLRSVLGQIIPHGGLSGPGAPVLLCPQAPGTQQLSRNRLDDSSSTEGPVVVHDGWTQWNRKDFVDIPNLPSYDRVAFQ